MSVWDPLLLSAKVAALATVAAALPGIALGRLVARRSFPGAALLDTLLLLPMVLPPSVVGFLLLLLLGKNGVLGRWLAETFDLSLLFTWQAAVIASAVVAFPLMYQAAKSAFARFEEELEEAARTDGAGEWQVFWRVTMPLAAPALLAGLVLTYARALGEFGATLMVAGNIPGITQTAPVAVFFAAEAGDGSKAWVLSLGLIGLSYLCVALHRLLLRTGPMRTASHRQNTP